MLVRLESESRSAVHFIHICPLTIDEGERSSPPSKLQRMDSGGSREVNRQNDVMTVRKWRRKGGKFESIKPVQSYWEQDLKDDTTKSALSQTPSRRV